MKIRVGIIGDGHIAKRHKQVLAENSNFLLLGVSDSNKSDFSSNENIFRNSDIDLVSVCTPSGNHTDIAIEALKNGKHVLVEKPMALSSIDCQKMIDTAKQNSRSFFVVKQNRFNAPIRDLNIALENGLLGKIFQVEVKAFWNRNEAYYKNSSWRGTKALDGGIMFNQFSHFVDILYFLFGEIYPQKTILQNSNHPYIEFEDSLISLFKTKDDAIGSINVSTNSTNQNMEGSLTIIAEKATIKIGGKYLNQIDYFEVKPELNKKLKEEQLFLTNSNQNNHKAVYESVFDALQGKHSKSLASAEEGKKVVEIIENIYKSAQ